jgi:hypothetical protein
MLTVTRDFTPKSSLEGLFGIPELRQPEGWRKLEKSAIANVDKTMDNISSSLASATPSQVRPFSSHFLFFLAVTV